MSTKFTCRFCKEQFDIPKGLYKHLQLAHNAGASRDNRTCPICGVLCSKYEGYRDHLLYIHGQADDGQKLTFKSLNEFLVWKTELELKHNCKYVLQTSPKVLPTKEKKYFYQCDRSDSKSKDKKSMSVVMKTCSSVISVVEGPGVFKVEYWDSHSGHSETTVQSVQSELEAAISSVEMVNAIADSDDSSLERSDELILPDNSSPSIPNSGKQTFFMKTHSPSNVNNVNNASPSNIRKTKIMQPSSIKVDGPKKKNTNTSILYSLASVACGKGISKKTPNKTDESKSTDALSTTKTDAELSSKNISEKSDDSSVSVPEEANINSTLNETVSEVVPVMQESSFSSSPPSTTAVSTTSASLSKTTSSGRPAIAPKVTVGNNSINSLFTGNSAFPNQFVIVNPIGMDQNSNQNVFTAGQNFLLSLGSLGQNILPTNTTSQSINAGGEKNVASTNTKTAKAETSMKNTSNVKINSSNVTATSGRSLLSSKQNTSSSVTSSVSSTATSTAPITLTSGLNNAPVILSSLPVGSTFMSVNNSLIPIATPSGTFLPTSLPPNIVLTPVVSGTTVSSTDSSVKTTFSSTSAPSPSIQAQVRYTTPSTVAITVSSIVKEPVYTSSTIKHMSNIVTSSTSPVTATASMSKNKAQNKFTPVAVSGRVSPHKNASKFMTSTPIKTYSNRNKNSSNKSMHGLSHKYSIINASAERVNSILSKSTLATVMSAVSVSSDTGVKTTSSARKRINRSTGKFKPLGSSSLKNTSPASVSGASSSVNTKVVNSQLNLAPISSAPNVTITPQQMNVHKPGTLLFESSGDVYMLEPVENDVAEHTPPLKSISSSKTSVIKIDRSVQTNESSNMAALKSKLQRKRAAPPTDDSAVMLKVKCYQLEMKYLNIQAECKRLKVELTKERLKNADLTGQTVPPNVEEEECPDTSRSKAVEIMKEIEDKFSENKDANVYTMTKTSVLRSLYEDLEGLCIENSELHKELDNYRAHDKFYKSLKKKLYEEEF